MNHLKRAIELSQKSYDAGEFPAGAVLVSKSGNIYESDHSVPYNHGEMMVIDKAIKAEGFPLNGATIFASMEPCLMCASKMYWAGVTKAEYVIPKKKVNAKFAYENPDDITEQIKTFFTEVELIPKPELFDEAIVVYQNWVNKIEKSKLIKE